MNSLKTLCLFPLADLSHLSSESPEHDCRHQDVYSLEKHRKFEILGNFFYA